MRTELGGEGHLYAQEQRGAQYKSQCSSVAAGIERIIHQMAAQRATTDPTAPPPKRVSVSRAIVSKLSCSMILWIRSVCTQMMFRLWISFNPTKPHWWVNFHGCYIHVKCHVIRKFMFPKSGRIVPIKAKYCRKHNIHIYKHERKPQFRISIFKTCNRTTEPS